MITSDLPELDTLFDVVATHTPVYSMYTSKNSHELLQGLLLVFSLNSVCGRELWLKLLSPCIVYG